MKACDSQSRYWTLRTARVGGTGYRSTARVARYLVDAEAYERHLYLHKGLVVPRAASVPGIA
eukprot:1949855-Rhodomonas_salina.12